MKIMKEQILVFKVKNDLITVTIDISEIQRTVPVTLTVDDDSPVILGTQGIYYDPSNALTTR